MDCVGAFFVIVQFFFYSININHCKTKKKISKTNKQNKKKKQNQKWWNALFHKHIPAEMSHYYSLTKRIPDRIAMPDSTFSNLNLGSSIDHANICIEKKKYDSNSSDWIEWKIIIYFNVIAIEFKRKLMQVVGWLHKPLYLQSNCTAQSSTSQNRTQMNMESVRHTTDCCGDELLVFGQAFLKRTPFSS